MVYASQQRLEVKPERTEMFDLLELGLDPEIVLVARQIYHTYYEANSTRMQTNPLGVAINKYTYRGKVILSRKPILLPQECFVPFNLIESEIY